MIEGKEKLIMENVLYKAKGLQKSHNTIMTVMIVISAILEIVLMIMSQAKQEALNATVVTSSGYTVSSGTLGGGYVLSEDGRNFMMGIGIVLIVIALLSIETLVLSNKSYITVFDSRVEGMQYAAFIFCVKKPINVAYDKIKDVQYIKAQNALSTDKIVLHTGYDKLIIVVKDCEKAYQIIKEKIA